MKKIINTILLSTILSTGAMAQTNLINEFEKMLDPVQYSCRESDETKKCKCDCLSDFCDDNGGSFECGASDSTGKCHVGWCVIGQ